MLGRGAPKGGTTVVDALPVSSAAWGSCTDPGVMLHAVRGKADDHSLRLFACACVREIFALARDPRSRQAVEVAELFAEGKASAEALDAARKEANAAELAVPHAARFAALATTKPDAWIAAWDASWDAAEAVATPRKEDGKSIAPIPFDEVRAHQAQLLRALVPPPTPPAIDPSWLRWNDSTVFRIAQGIREQQRYQDLPILADALAEAGCTDEAILSCRVRSPNLKSSWIVDALLSLPEQAPPEEPLSAASS
jgi:hypothetical protein